MKVLIGDPVSEEGIEILRQHAEVDVKLGLKEDELVATIGDYEAVVVRSQTRITAKVIQAGKKLQVVARAGAGVDTIDVDEATRHGIMILQDRLLNFVSSDDGLPTGLPRLLRRVSMARLLSL